jgi:uncharacterized protein YndB with AHSA1/START domain
MIPVRGGRLHRTPNGLELTIRRQFNASIADVWRSITDPEATARWYGTWEGEGGTGKTVRIQMAFEEGKPWYEARIDACDPPRYLAMTCHDGGAWVLSITLNKMGGGTELVFAHHKIDPKMVPDIGTGWEYYLDNLVASREGRRLPAFAEYYPQQKVYYQALLNALGPLDE